MPLFDIHVIVDWSARSEPSPARPTGDAIWFAVAEGCEVGAPVYLRTRAEAVARLGDLAAAWLAEGKRVLIGFDFPFGYPEGVAERLTGRAEAFALWDWLAARVGDGPGNANTRYRAAEEINAAYEGLGPCWGRPAAWDVAGVPVGGKARFGADHPPERRRADKAAKGAKTVWQLAYNGSVGSQVLLGLPALKQLREDVRLKDDLAVWPFDTGLCVPDAPLVLAEIYPSLFAGAVRAGQRAGEIKDAAQVRITAEAFAALDRLDGLGPVFDGPEGLSDADRRVIETEEAWILGVGHESAFGSAARRPQNLSYIKDPKAIYAQSFATVRAEADLGRFPADLAEVAIRLIHACGMVDLVDDLAFSPDAVAAGREALARGRPVLCDCEMVAAGVIRRGLPEGVDVRVTLNEAGVPALAAEMGTTRSAAAVSLWEPWLEGAVVAIGNAPTALFHLLERVAAGAPRPAVILGFPVGFVGAAESKAALEHAGLPFLALRGRRGGSALASAAVNGLALGLAGDGTG